MNIDFSQPILDQHDAPMTHKVAGEDVPITLGFVASEALFAPMPGDEKVEGIKKRQMGDLGLRLVKGGEQEVSPEDVVLIRDRIGKGCTSIVIARAFAMLD